MKKQSSITWILGLCLSLWSFLSLPVLVPHWHLYYFAPWLILSYYRFPKFFCLLLSLFCGAFIDLYTADYAMGVHALNYTLATALLYSRKMIFFEDQKSSLPILTALFSITITALFFLTSPFLGRKVSLTFSLILTDFFFMPLLDAFYAYLVFGVGLKWIGGKIQVRRYRRLRN